MTDNTPEVTPDDATLQAAEAAAFRRLIAHLQHRNDVQNVDLMAVGGFCRNCLSDWFGVATATQGAPISKDAARAYIYGMSYDQYKAQHQTPASDTQIAAMAASVARNR